MSNCPQCDTPLEYQEESNSWYCQTCQQQVQNTAADQAPQSAGPTTLALQQFSGSQFTIKQKKLAIANKYFVSDASGQTVAFVQQKMLKLKEDIRVYTDDSKSTEIMRIQQANILDFSGSFNVIDSQTEEVVGVLKRKGLKSMLKDEWKILDGNQQEVGLIKEQGGLIWLLRRFNMRFIPYKYFVELQGQRAATVTEKFQIIGDTYIVDLHDSTLDPRLGVAIGLMMDIGEGE